VELTVLVELQLNKIKNFVVRNTRANKNFCYIFFVGFCAGFFFPITVFRLYLKGRPLLLSINAIKQHSGRANIHNRNTIGAVNTRLNILVLIVKNGFTDAFVRQTSSYSRSQRNSSGLLRRLVSCAFASYVKYSFNIGQSRYTYTSVSRLVMR